MKQVQPWFGLAVISMIFAVAACAPTPAAQPEKPAAQATTAPPAAPAKPAAKEEQPAAKAPAAPSEAAPTDLDKLIAAAKPEGTISIVTHPSTQWKGWVPVFEKRFPDLKVEYLGMRPSEVTPRIVSEQKNGVFNFDVYVAPTANSVKTMSPVGTFQDLRPFFALPEAIDNSKWYGGLDQWAEKDERYSLIVGQTLTYGVIVNRRLVPKPDFSTLDDLLNPALKGKIVIYDPRAPNNGSLMLGAMLLQRDEAFVRQVMQDAVFVDSPAQLNDFVNSGRHPIGIGSDADALEKLREEGLTKDIEVTRLAVNAAASGIAVFKNAPHPNAAKLAVNWFLSQEGQEAYAREGKTVSRRVGVPSYLGDSLSYDVPDWNNLDSYLRGNEWKGIAEVDRVNEIAKDIKR